MNRNPDFDLNDFRHVLTVCGDTLTYFVTESGCLANEVMTGGINRHDQPKRAPVYEVVSGQPTWGRLYRLASESTAHLAVNSIVRAIKTEGRRCNSVGMRGWLRLFSKWDYIGCL